MVSLTWDHCSFALAQPRPRYSSPSEMASADAPASGADCLCRLCGHKFRLDQGRSRSAQTFECHPMGSLLRGETSFRVRSTSWTPKRPWKSREQEWSTANTSWKQMFWSYAGVQTAGFTRWLRQTPAMHQTVAVSRLLQRREALFVRKDGPDVWLLQWKRPLARAFFAFS